MKKEPVLGILIFLAGSVLFGQDIKTESLVDWERHILTIKISSPLPDSDKTLALRKQEALVASGNVLQSAFMQGISEIYISSTQTVGARLEKNPSTLFAVQALCASGVKSKEYLSTDLKVLNIEYTYVLCGLLPILFPGSGNFIDSRLDRYEPTAQFTGLVILTEGDFPVQGENSRATLNKSLTFRIYDEDMNLIYDYRCLNPEFLKTTGMALYTSNADSNLAAARAGLYPLYCVAVKVYGENRTDIIIPSDIARKLLALKANRKILNEGRIVILDRGL